MKWFLVWHDDSPGSKVYVRRRWLKNRRSAWPGEISRRYRQGASPYAPPINVPLDEIRDLTATAGS